MKLEGKQIGVFVALILAFGMLILPDPGQVQPFSPQQLASKISEQKNYILPSKLQLWINQEKKDFILIDVRSKKEYSQEFIPSAISMPLTELILSDNLRNFSSTEKIILYSKKNILSAQGWVLLKLANKNVYFVKGGISSWNDMVRGKKVLTVEKKKILKDKKEPKKLKKPHKKIHHKKKHGEEDEGC